MKQTTEKIVPKSLLLEGELYQLEEGLAIETREGEDILLIKEVEKIFDVGDTIFVSTYISDTTITYEQVKNDMAFMAMGLLDEADYHYVYWSELTGSSLSESLVIGGHNLKEILSDYTGKYIVIHIYDRKSIIDEILQELDS